MRKLEIQTDEYYHIFNHGIDTSHITLDRYDSDRFVQSLNLFNSINLTGSIYEQSFIKPKLSNDVMLDSKMLVNVISYCFNPNHFHLLLQQNVDGGIARFMHRLTMGYSKYFNAQHKRKGSLFRGSFKAVYIQDDDQLLYTMMYVAYNNKIHKLGHSVSKLVRSNAAYLESFPDDENLKVIFDQFDNKKAFDEYATDVIDISQKAKIDQNEVDED